MCTLISTVIPILEVVVARCSLPALLYLCEVTEDGSVLGGVELELPGDSSAPVPRRDFFGAQPGVVLSMLMNRLPSRL